MFDEQVGQLPGRLLRAIDQLYLVAHDAPEERLIDSAEETARELADLLVELGLAAGVNSNATERWVATDDAARFARVGAVFMGGSPAPVEVVDLGGDARSGEGREVHP